MVSGVRLAASRLFMDQALGSLRFFFKIEVQLFIISEKSGQFQKMSITLLDLPKL